MVTVVLETHSNQLLEVPTCWGFQQTKDEIIRKSYENHGEHIGTSLVIVGLFLWYFYGKICLKTAANYSASFWSYNFRFAYGRTLKPSLSWFPDFRTCLFLQNQLSFSLERPGYHNTSKKTPESCSKNICLKIRKWISKIWQFWKKGGRRTIRSINLINSWKSWIWDQYLPENAKWTFGKSL